MAIKANHDDLPTDAGGWRPDSHPRYLPIFAEAWKARTEASWAKPIAGGTRMRLSKVGQCARETGYFLKGEPETNPPSIADQFRMGTGTMMHDDMVLPILRDALGEGAEIEALVTLADRDDANRTDLSGRIDLFYVRDGDKRSVLELKTTGGFGFKLMVGARGAAEGPKKYHIMQAAIAGYQLDADEITLLYLSMENLSPRERDKLGADELARFGAEWTIQRDTFEPIALAELKRQRRILDIVERGELPPRSIPELPAQARITDPAKGLWTIEVGGEIVQSGSHWGCAPYCRQWQRCVADGAS